MDMLTPSTHHDDMSKEGTMIDKSIDIELAKLQREIAHANKWRKRWADQADDLEERLESATRSLAELHHDRDQLMRYIDRAKAAANRYGRVSGQPLDHFIRELGEYASLQERPEAEPLAQGEVIMRDTPKVEHHKPVATRIRTYLSPNHFNMTNTKGDGLPPAEEPTLRERLVSKRILPTYITRRDRP